MAIISALSLDLRLTQMSDSRTSTIKRTSTIATSSPLVVCLGDLLCILMVRLDASFGELTTLHGLPIGLQGKLRAALTLNVALMVSVLVKIHSFVSATRDFDPSLMTLGPAGISL